MSPPRRISTGCRGVVLPIKVSVLTATGDDNPLSVEEQGDLKYLQFRFDPKDLLDRMCHLCRGKSEPMLDLCRKFNAETRDGQRMRTYSRLLGDAISSLIKVKETTDLFSFLAGDSGSLFSNKVRGLDDLELICFLIIR